MEKYLKEALDTLIEIENTSSMNEKLRLLNEQKDNYTLKEILHFSFNPYIKTGLGYTKLTNAKEDTESWLDISCPIEGIFNYLILNGTGRDTDASYVRKYIDLFDEKYTAILYKIFTKLMNIGISATTIHKVWPGLIPGFGVQLACAYDNVRDSIDNKVVMVTQKFDGNRCFARVKNHKCTFYSRSGKEITGLDTVENELSRLVDGWYDGELMAETFTDTQSQVRRKGKKEVIFHIFDYLLLEEVLDQNCIHTYIQRRQRLENIFKNIEKFKNVELVPIIARGICTYDWIIEMLDKYSDIGWEGIMLNDINATYKFYRTSDLVKVKRSYTLDLKVLSVEEGNGTFEGTMGKMIVDYKGYTVGVGSGLNKEMREYYWKRPDELVGKIIEVRYNEISKDKSGNLSLRFPRFVRIRNDKTEPSYD